jgi:hypothetical protein
MEAGQNLFGSLSSDARHGHPHHSLPPFPSEMFYVPVGAPPSTTYFRASLPDDLRRSSMHDGVRGFAPHVPLEYRRSADSIDYGHCSVDLGAYRFPIEPERMILPRGYFYDPGLRAAVHERTGQSLYAAVGHGPPPVMNVPSSAPYYRHVLPENLSRAELRRGRSRSRSNERLGMRPRSRSYSRSPLREADRRYSATVAWPPLSSRRSSPQPMHSTVRSRSRSPVSPPPRRLKQEIAHPQYAKSKNVVATTAHPSKSGRIVMKKMVPPATNKYHAASTSSNGKWAFRPTSSTATSKSFPPTCVSSTVESFLNNLTMDSATKYKLSGSALATTIPETSGFLRFIHEAENTQNNHTGAHVDTEAVQDLALQEELVPHNDEEQPIPKPLPESALPLGVDHSLPSDASLEDGEVVIGSCHSPPPFFIDTIGDPNLSLGNISAATIDLNASQPSLTICMQSIPDTTVSLKSESKTDNKVAAPPIHNSCDELILPPLT